jgi:hypothetical protein
MLITLTEDGRWTLPGYGELLSIFLCPSCQYLCCRRSQCIIRLQLCTEDAALWGRGKGGGCYTYTCLVHQALRQLLVCCRTDMSHHR